MHEHILQFLSILQLHMSWWREQRRRRWRDRRCPHCLSLHDIQQRRWESQDAKGGRERWIMNVFIPKFYESIVDLYQSSVCSHICKTVHARAPVRRWDNKNKRLLSGSVLCIYSLTLLDLSAMLFSCSHFSEWHWRIQSLRLTCTDMFFSVSCNTNDQQVKVGNAKTTLANFLPSTTAKCDFFSVHK